MYYVTMPELTGEKREQKKGKNRRKHKNKGKKVQDSLATAEWAKYVKQLRRLVCNLALSGARGRQKKVQVTQAICSPPKAWGLISQLHLPNSASTEGRSNFPKNKKSREAEATSS